MTNLHRSPPMNQSETDFGIVNESQLLRFGITAEAERAIRAMGLVRLYGPAGGAYRGAVGIGPADHLEGCLGFPVSHAEDLSEAQGLCCTAEEEVLGHLITYRI